MNGLSVFLIVAGVALVLWPLLRADVNRSREWVVSAATLDRLDRMREDES